MFSPVRLRFITAAILTLVTLAAPALVTITAPSVQADDSPTDGVNSADQPSTNALASLARLTVSPVTLNGGGKLTLISPERWSALSREVVSTLKETQIQLTELFGEIPPFTTSVRLTDQDSFHRSTGAPKWTNALFYRGQILIPLALDVEPDLQNLKRSVRHEYTHAVINALSGGRAPGWIDEGLAQWIEGEENPVLRPALYKWLQKNGPVPLALMQGGFTRLEPEMVPAAYAQSLFSTTVVINTFGFKGIRKYFDGLNANADKDTAFQDAFAMNTDTFELRLAKTLQGWEAGQPIAKAKRAAAGHTTSTLHG